MIFISRPTNNFPSLDQAATKEQEKYEQYLLTWKRKVRVAKKGKKIKSFEYGAYKDDTVKEALEKAFHYKCAYCESRYEAVVNMQVEHYRPKAKVTLGSKVETDGYPWLAASFTNLLPSCVRCNSPTREFVPALNKKITVGKANWFPLKDETFRAKAKGEEANEIPLILNPCEDKPENYLYFDKDGLVSPQLDLDELDRMKAEQTIRILGLGRQSLIRVRADHAIRIRGQISRILDHYASWRSNSSESEKKWLLREWNDLNHLLSPTEPYLAMARNLVKELIVKHIQEEIMELAENDTS